MKARCILLGLVFLIRCTSTPHTSMPCDTVALEQLTRTIASRWTETTASSVPRSGTVSLRPVFVTDPAHLTLTSDANIEKSGACGCCVTLLFDRTGKSAPLHRIQVFLPFETESEALRAASELLTALRPEHPHVPWESQGSEKFRSDTWDEPGHEAIRSFRQVVTRDENQWLLSFTADRARLEAGTNQSGGAFLGIF
jgi:hypothetical protein